MYRGHTLSMLDRYEEALASYEQAIAIRPDWSWAWYRKAVMLAVLDRTDEALAAVEESLRLDGRQHLCSGIEK
jgi:tetratricopeptide (TPR) repeat protein